MAKRPTQNDHLFLGNGNPLKTPIPQNGDSALHQLDSFEKKQFSQAALVGSKKLQLGFLSRPCWVFYGSKKHTSNKKTITGSTLFTMLNLFMYLCLFLSLMMLSVCLCFVTSYCFSFFILETKQSSTQHFKTKSVHKRHTSSVKSVWIQ